MSRSTMMVALRDAESAESLVRLACQLAKGKEAELVALHAVEIPATLPLDADSEILDRPGMQIISLARRLASEELSKQISARLVGARQAGEAIVGEAKEHGVELLVMGYHQPHRCAGEILLGSTVQYVARHAPCRGLAQIPPIDGRHS